MNRGSKVLIGFGQNVRNRHLILGLTQQELADTVGMLNAKDTPMRRLGEKIGQSLPARLRKYWPDFLGPLLLHENAARILKELGPAAKPALPDLIRILQTEKTVFAFSSLDAIEAIGPDAVTALPALHSAWTNQDKLFRYHVAGAIWSVGRETNAILNFCVAELTGPNDGLWSVGMASKLDEASRQTFADVLMHRLQDTAHPETHDEAAIGLGRIDIADEATQRTLLEGTKDSDQEVRNDCAVALSKLWPTNAAFASLGIHAFLERAAQKPDDTLVNFVRYVHYTGFDPNATSSALKEYLNDDDPKIRALAAKDLKLLEASKQCAFALSKIWPTNAAFASLSIRHVLEWTAQKSGGTSDDIAEGVTDIVEGVKYSWVDRDTATATLKEYLNDDDPKIRAQAAKGLELLEASKSSPPEARQ